MKLNVLLWTAALLGAFLPRSADGRPAEDPAARRLAIPRPLLLHQGEEFSLRLGGGSSPSSSSSSAMNRALLQLIQRLLQARAEQQEDQGDDDGEEEKGKRSEEAPISLDLTFHLLREVLEMARAEQIAQQADSNRRMMDSFGK
ncbi:corticoliberin-1-like [Salarias fasciatus]|uniref:Corticoliberin-1-like n=1 Tax=Salarias fasciatus TaxID=181472 RepID=A0A672FTV0_SALFA|nr:corticoliberin-1-like [Salarias fasciatus]